MRRATGPGRERAEHASFPTLVSTRLYNFDVDSDELKNLHQHWLDQHVIHPGIAPGGRRYVVLHGFASRTHDEGYNDQLSNRRAQRVRAYLAGHGVSESRILLS